MVDVPLRHAVEGPIDSDDPERDNLPVRVATMGPLQESEVDGIPRRFGPMGALDSGPQQ